MAKRPSSVTQKLPPEIQGEIVRLRERGKTIDQIMEKLRELAPEADVSRSALGRHVKWLDEEFEDLRRSRQVAEHLSAALEDGRDAHSARINIQLMHNEVFELLRQTRQMARMAEEATEGGVALGLGDRAKAVAAIGRTLANVTRAARTNLDYIAAVRAEAAEAATKEAAGKAAEAAKSQGMSSETAEFIKAFVLGVKAP